jgi:hypothetical protein
MSTTTTQTVTTTAWASSAGIVHLDVNTCLGLDHMRQAEVDPTTRLKAVELEAGDFPLVTLLAPDRHYGQGLQPCRLCAVAPIGAELLSLPDDREAPTTFVTFTPDRPRHQRARSSGRGTDPDRVQAIYRIRQQALKTMAVAGNLRVVDADRRRPAAYGFITTTKANLLDRLVDLEQRRSVTTWPRPEVVQTFWGLLAGRGGIEDTGGEDPWTIAETLHL